MSAEATTAPPQESNTARKKRERAAAAEAAKAAEPTPETRPDTPSQPSQDNAAVANTNGATNGDHASSESPYVKDLVKQVRNINKKLSASAKVDAIIASNPSSSLDELVAAKKINADQKAQIHKKPQLEAQLRQLEEQVAQYRKIDSDYQSKFAAEQESLKTKYEKELEEARSSSKTDADASVNSLVREKLLIFSQFLRTAAAKRANEDEADSEESRAFEGALLLVYGGDSKAVEAAENIVNGANEAVPSTEGQPLSIKYAQIKTVSVQESTYTSSESYETIEATPGDSDPTIANAGLTELSAGDFQPIQQIAQTNGDHHPAQSSTGEDGANNAAAGAKWDSAAAGTEKTELPLEESFEIIPRDPAETDTPNAVAPTPTGIANAAAETGAGLNHSSSWADDAAENDAGNVKKVDDDGFHEVQGRHHHRGRGGHPHRGDGEGRGRGRGRGGFRGGERGEHRGRGGFRGEGRGRGGEGRGRGGRGGPRGGAPTTS